MEENKSLFVGKQDTFSNYKNGFKNCDISRQKNHIRSHSFVKKYIQFVIYVLMFLPVCVRSAQINEDEKFHTEFQEDRLNDFSHYANTENNPEAPFFDLDTPTNVTVTASKVAILSCIVHNLGNNSVSWIRHNDLQIMSVGKATYTNDDRFRVVPKETANDWTLRIQYAQSDDSGQYDCQISTRPPIGRTIHLNVIEPRARILRAPEMHVSAGSLINLTCIIPYSPETPEYLYWYHKERMVRENGNRVVISNQLGTRSISQLVVKNANAEDSGIYTCSPAHSREQSITVHVVTDGYPAAMQGGSSVTSVGHKKLLWAMISPLLLALVMSCKPYFYM